MLFSLSSNISNLPKRLQTKTKNKRPKHTHTQARAKLPKKRRRILPVEQPRAPTRNVSSREVAREIAGVNARAIGRRTARANIMDLNQNEIGHRANHVNNVHEGKHHAAKPNGGTAADTSTTFRPLEPRRDPPVRLPLQNAPKKSITSDVVKLPERASLLSGGK